MMKTCCALAVFIAIATQPSHASVAPASPGSGGAFISVDVSANGTVLVGSDLSGVYRRSGTDNWTRRGYYDGLEATGVPAVKWKPGSNSIALAGTRGGLYRSTDGGISWSKVTSGVTWGNDDVLAIGWSSTSQRVYLCTRPSSGNVSIRKSNDDGASWSTVTQSWVGSTDQFIKIAVVGSPSDGSRVWFLSGHEGSRALYQSSDGGSTAGQVNLPSGYPIDVAVDSLHQDIALITASHTSADVKTGVLYHYNQANQTPITGSLSGATTDATGAVWFCGGKAYMLNIGEDACGSNPPSHSGKFVITSTDATWADPTAIAVAKQDDGQGTHTNTDTWDTGWTSCNRARGPVYDSPAISVSARGEYWITTSHIWRHNAMTSEPAGDHKYENAFSNEGSAPYATKLIDNTNAVAIALTSTNGRLYAGYNDIGVWLSTNSGATWTKKTPAAHSSGYGGNVTSLVYLGSASGNDSLYSTMSVTHEADSLNNTKYRYYLWRSLDGGSSWTGYGDLPGGWLSGFTRDKLTGKMWCTSDGKLYSSTNSGAAWNAVTPSQFPTDGLYTIAAYGGHVYVGGWNKLWVSNGSGFSEVKFGSGTSFDFSGDKGEVGTDLNHFQWNGIHQILINPTTSEVWVTSYAGYNYSGSAGKGLFRGALGESTITQLVDAKLYRGVAQDSCEMRIHVTSGEPATNGANDGAVIAAANGKVIYRLSGTVPPGTFNGNVSHDALDRYPFGAAVVADGAGKIYASVPGYGIVVEEMSVAGECQTELHGGGDMRMRRAPVEGAPARQQTHFTLAQAREAKLVLYDLTGRKAVQLSPGIYFERVEVIPKQYRRRTVIVTP